MAHDLLDFCYPGRVPRRADDRATARRRYAMQCLEALAAARIRARVRRLRRAAAERGRAVPVLRRRGVPHFERVVRLGVFDDPLKSLVHQIKYHNRWSLAEYLADRCCARPAESGAAGRLRRDRARCPLHPLRHIARGYNQAELIARRLAQRSRQEAAARRSPASAARPRRRTCTPGPSALENLRDAFGLINAQASCTAGASSSSTT